MITKSGDVDTNKEGNYMIVYDVIDSDGNEAVSVIRTVNVIEGPANWGLVKARPC